MPLLAGLAFYLLLVQPLLVTLASPASAALGPNHGHVALGAVPDHSHWYDVSSDDSPIPPGCGSADHNHDSRGGEEPAALTCVAPNEISGGAVTAMILAAEPKPIRLAGVERRVIESSDASLNSWHARPVTPPPEHAL